jgi:chromosome segregation ATPase
MAMDPADLSWLQQMLQAIQESVSETNRNVTETNRNVTETKQAIATLQEKVVSIANEQERLDKAINQHENDFREIRKDLGEIKNNAKAASDLADKFKSLEGKHDEQAKLITELREWKLKREAAWSGPTVMVAAVGALLPIIAAIYGIFQFVANNT